MNLMNEQSMLRHKLHKSQNYNNASKVQLGIIGIMHGCEKRKCCISIPSVRDADHLSSLLYNEVSAAQTSKREVFFYELFLFLLIAEGRK